MDLARPPLHQGNAETRDLHASAPHLLGPLRLGHGRGVPQDRAGRHHQHGGGTARHRDQGRSPGDDRGRDPGRHAPGRDLPRDPARVRGDRRTPRARAPHHRGTQGWRARRGRRRGRGLRQGRRAGQTRFDRHLPRPDAGHRDDPARDHLPLQGEVPGLRGQVHRGVHDRHSVRHREHPFGSPRSGDLRWPHGPRAHGQGLHRPRRRRRGRVAHRHQKVGQRTQTFKEVKKLRSPHRHGGSMWGAVIIC